MIGEIDSHTEIIILSYILNHPQYFKFTGKKLFKYKILNEILSSIIAFYNDYAEVPTEQQLRNSMTMSKDGNLSLDISDAITQIYEDCQQDDEWLRQVTEGYIQMVSLKKNMEKAVDFYSTTDISLQNANDVVNKCIDIIDNTRSVSFDGDMGTNFFDASTYKVRTLRTIPYQFPTFSKKVNNIEYGTLTCYIGKTNVGKSVFLCNDAAFYVKQGYNVVFISCEMSEDSVKQRIACNLFNKTAEEYNALLATESGIANELAKFRSSIIGNVGKLYIKRYPTGACSTIDIDNYVRSIEETMGFKVHVIIVDYLGIMCNFRDLSGRDQFSSQKSIAQDLRAIGIKRDLVVITACQVNRGSYEINDDIDLKNIAESIGIGYTADVIFGIIQTEKQLEDNRYKLKIVKNRNGAKQDAYINIDIDYERMKLKEA